MSCLDTAGQLYQKTFNERIGRTIRCAAIGGILFLLGACAGGAAVSDSSLTADQNQSPLAELLGVTVEPESRDVLKARFAVLQVEAEDAVASCLAAQGFRYERQRIPVEPQTEASVQSREYAVEYGFGIASRPTTLSDGPGRTNYNVDYLASLSAAEVEAYDSALGGPEGCHRVGYRNVVQFGKVIDEFADEFDQIVEQYDADPRIVLATTQWAKCMAEAGYRFPNPTAAAEDVQRQHTAIVSEPGAYVEPPVEDPQADRAVSFHVPTLTSESKAQIDALAVEERSVAVASWDCNGQLRDIEPEIQLEYERQFVDEFGGAIATVLEG